MRRVIRAVTAVVAAVGLSFAGMGVAYAADSDAVSTVVSSQARSGGPAITAVEKPSVMLKKGASYNQWNNAVKPVFKVTVTGLTPGVGYGITTNLDSSQKKPQIGSKENLYSQFDTLFNATSGTQVVDVAYRGGDPGTDTIWFALYEGDDKAETSSADSAAGVAPAVDIVPSLYGTVVNIYDGVKVDFVPAKVTLTGVSLDDVGVHTVGLTGRYSMDPRLVPEVKSICYSTTVFRIFAQRGKLEPNEWDGHGTSGLRTPWDCVTNPVPDTDPQGATYASVQNLTQGDVKSRVLMGQWYTHASTVTSGIKATGEIKDIVPGLIAGTKYGNWGDEDPSVSPDVLYLSIGESNGTSPDPASSVYSGLLVTFKDESTYETADGDGIAEPNINVPEFTTKTSGKTVSSAELTDGNRNGVTGADNGKAQAGSVYRVYVDGLKQSTECAAAAKSGRYCYWTGYIYSDPQRMSSPDGNASAVQVDAAGKTYVEYTIPNGYSGDHKVAVYDNSGELLGWTPVTVGASTGNKPDQPDNPVPSSRAVVYRAFNPNETRGGSHLYTTNKAEYDKVVKAGWRGEGPQFAASAVEKAAPVYRVYNPNDGSHHYTLSVAERDSLVRAGWRAEGVAWHVDKDASAPVYRVYNPNSGEHVFTLSKVEASAAVKAGWHDEGIAFNAYALN